MKSKCKKPYWRLVREQRLRGRKRIQYNWGWEAQLRSSIDKPDNSDDPIRDGWRN